MLLWRNNSKADKPRLKSWFLPSVIHNCLCTASKPTSKTPTATWRQQGRGSVSDLKKMLEQVKAVILCGYFDEFTSNEIIQTMNLGFSTMQINIISMFFPLSTSLSISRIVSFAVVCLYSLIQNSLQATEVYTSLSVKTGIVLLFAKMMPQVYSRNVFRIHLPRFSYGKTGKAIFERRVMKGVLLWQFIQPCKMLLNSQIWQ